MSVQEEWIMIAISGPRGIFRWIAFYMRTYMKHMISGIPHYNVPIARVELHQGRQNNRHLVRQFLLHNMRLCRGFIGPTLASLQGRY